MGSSTVYCIFRNFRYEKIFFQFCQCVSLAKMLSAKLFSILYMYIVCTCTCTYQSTHYFLEGTCTHVPHGVGKTFSQ